MKKNSKLFFPYNNEILILKFLRGDLFYRYDNFIIKICILPTLLSIILFIIVASDESYITIKNKQCFVHILIFHLNNIVFSQLFICYSYLIIQLSPPMANSVSNNDFFLKLS